MENMKRILTAVIDAEREEVHIASSEIQPEDFGELLPNIAEHFASQSGCAPEDEATAIDNILTSWMHAISEYRWQRDGGEPLGDPQP